VIINKF